jgi:hypothetical protein
MNILFRTHRTWVWESEPFTIHTPIGGKIGGSFKAVDINEIWDAMTEKWIPFPLFVDPVPPTPLSWREQQTKDAMDETYARVMASIDNLNQRFVDEQKIKRIGICKKCGSEIRDSFCVDETCPYSDWPQRVELEDLQNKPLSDLISKYGDIKKVRRTCKKCGSQLGDVYCSDPLCGFKDWPQIVEISDFYSMSLEDIEKKHNIKRRG